MKTSRGGNGECSGVVSGSSKNCKYLALFKNLVTLTSTNYTIKSIVSAYQLAHIYLAPGIEPGNLIRPTLIRSPPGAFFC